LPCTFMIFFIAWCMNPSTFSDILQNVKTYCFASSYHSPFESH
jgi:hypothetical protein